MTTIPAKPLILLTGATGYVGGRLLQALQAASYPVRCLARRPEFLAPRVSPDTEMIKGDCLDAASLAAIELPRGQDGIFEIGGADRVSYAGIMNEYARQRGLRRLMIPVPSISGVSRPTSRTAAGVSRRR